MGKKKLLQSVGRRAVIAGEGGRKCEEDVVQVEWVETGGGTTRKKKSAKKRGGKKKVAPCYPC